MAQIAGLQDFRQEGPPGDIGVFQATASIIVYQFTFSGVTYIVAQRVGVLGWTLVSQGTAASTVLQAAINALATTGGTIHLAPGTYTLTVTLVITTSNITIEGTHGGGVNIITGPRTGIEITGTAGAGRVFFTRIANLYIRGNEPTSHVGYGLYFNAYAGDSRLENVYINYCGQDAVYMGEMWGLVMTGCMLETCHGSGFTGIGGGFKIFGNKFLSNDDYGAYLGNGGGSSTDGTFYGNEISGSGKSGVVLYGKRFICGLCNFSTNSRLSLGTYYNLDLRANGCEAIGNTFYGDGTYVSADILSEADDQLIASNTCVGAKTYGILVQSHRCVITGNKVFNSAGYGIYIWDTYGYAEVTGNVLSNNTNYDICVRSNCPSNQIGPNQLLSVNKINDLGTDTRLPTVRASFIKELGTAAWIVTAAAPMGIDIDAADEGALAKIKLPADLQQIVRIKVFGIAQVAEADGMQLLIAAGSGIDNEAWNAEAIAVASKTSSTLNFANLDVVQWVFTSADDSDIGDLAAGDFLQWCCYYAAASGGNCATDLLLAGEGLEIQYV